MLMLEQEEEGRIFFVVVVFLFCLFSFSFFTFSLSGSFPLFESASLYFLAEKQDQGPLNT